jgi:hypothetical protein
VISRRGRGRRRRLHHRPAYGYGSGRSPIPLAVAAPWFFDPWRALALSLSFWLWPEPWAGSMLYPMWHQSKTLRTPIFRVARSITGRRQSIAGNRPNRPGTKGISGKSIASWPPNGRAWRERRRRVSAARSQFRSTPIIALRLADASSTTARARQRWLRDRSRSRL